ncbi:UPF0688 protein C1orf174-like [Oryzias melastigma]|uniref:UPF0688 protein C1orf174-like n=1 Tax=Oryzias melastigma TaxID=30732 RepID=A0A834F5I4_ORYME|nr:UPF0688 protein C1orf174 homolog [Oryzias melastigma]KAF6721870.1 UPF0688 protein C1orf174-like [Oryzias melastigma]KAF6721889.1 UPF0688 protein C1orf174-like [Oryzias melastigma]
MSGRLGKLRSRKRKSRSEPKPCRTVSTAGTGRLKRPRADSGGGSRGAGDPEKRSHEQQRSASRRRSTSVQPVGQEGKENELRTGEECDRKGAVPEKQELNPPACEDPDKPPFPDDDSNQILPVEQFFGNLDIVQDFPQRSPTTSAGVPKRSRRRQFLAMEDSEEEEGLSNTQ